MNSTEADEYSPTVEKKPYSGYSTRLSEHNVKTFKKDAVRVAAGLNAAGIGCELESPVLRKGELTSEKKPKFYSVDIAVKDARFERVASATATARSTSTRTMRLIACS